MRKRTRSRVPTRAIRPNVGNQTGIVPAGTIGWKKVCTYDDDELVPDALLGDGYRLLAKMVRLRLVEDGVVPFSERVPYSGGKSPRRRFWVSHNTVRKCRAPAVKVLGVYYVFARRPDVDLKGKLVLVPATLGRSLHEYVFVYRPGQVVRPHRFDKNADDVCTAGIHFFRTFHEALGYKY
jgi:hypothetical protein